MNIRQYADFDLAIEAKDEGFIVRVLASPAGQASGRFALPFTPIELENFVLKVGRTRSGVRKMGPPEGTAAETFGKRLYEAVFAGEVGICFRRSIDDAEESDRGLRVRIRTGDAPTLNNIPWEFVWAEGLGRFVALSNQTPVVRFIDLPTRIKPLAVKPPLRILVMVSNPTDIDRLDVQREVDMLKASTQDLVTSGRVELVVMEDANLVSLSQRLRREEFHIFHFIGHGGFAEGDGVLVLEDSSERARPVKGQHLGTIFHDHGSLRLAVLNSCEGARSSAEDPFSGVAPSLVRQGIPAVIAMQFEITDTAAIQFAHEFYLAVADGYPVDAAVTEARKQIFSADNDLEWATPVLYMRAPDGMIFDLTAAPVPVPKKDEDPPPPAPGKNGDSPVPVVLKVPPSPPGAAADTDWYEKALQAIEFRNWSDAIGFLHKTLELDPNHPGASAQLQEAQRRVHASALLDEGRSAHAAGKWEEALASLREAAALDPDFTDEEGLLADAAFRVEVLRQPAEPLEEPTGAPTSIPVPAPVEAGPRVPPPPASAPRTTPSARGARRPLLVIVAIVAIALLVWILTRPGPSPGPETDISSTTAGRVVIPETTASASTATTAVRAVLPTADITALMMASPPVIDADGSEWSIPPQAASEFFVSGRGEMPWQPTAAWRIGWDAEALYIFVEAFDPEILQPWIDAPDQLWRGDSVHFEFGPDPRGLEAGAALRPEDLHALFGPTGQSGPAAALVAVNRVRGTDISPGHDEPDIEAFFVTTDAPGYRMEARIPWNVLGVSDPTVGTMFAMNVNISDGNGVLQTMASSNPDRDQPHPGTWNTLVLGEQE